MSELCRPVREIVAHHEAAHAVIALELGDGLLDVGIDLDRVDATGGVGNVGCRLFIADLNDVAPNRWRGGGLSRGQCVRTRARSGPGRACP